MWDHKINMKEGFEPKSFKNYNLTPEEQKGLDKFLNENLEKAILHMTFCSMQMIMVSTKGSTS